MPIAKTMSERENIHATVLAIGDRGILIAGPSASGKTTLALTLIAQAHRDGRFARLVSDDRVWISVAGGRLIARAPRQIVGLAEVRGLGLRPVEHLPAAVVELAVELVPAEAVPRLPDPVTEVFLGCAIPLLRLAARDAPLGAIAVAAWLGRLPFRSDAPA